MVAMATIIKYAPSWLSLKRLDLRSWNFACRLLPMRTPIFAWGSDHPYIYMFLLKWHSCWTNHISWFYEIKIWQVVMGGWAQWYTLGVVVYLHIDDNFLVINFGSQSGQNTRPQSNATHVQMKSVYPRLKNEKARQCNAMSMQFQCH